MPEAGWCSIKITHAVYSLGQTLKYGLKKLESLSSWKRILLTSPQGHGSGMLIWFSMCAHVFLCVAFVHKCWGGWGRLKGYRMGGGAGKDGSFTRALYVQWGDWTVFLHVLPLHFSHYLSACDPVLCPLWFSLMTIFTYRIRKVKRHKIMLHWCVWDKHHILAFVS